MQSHIKLIVFLAIGGFGAGAIGSGGLSSIDLKKLNANEIEKFINSIDLGPLNGLVNDMKVAIITAKEELPKLLEMVNQNK